LPLQLLLQVLLGLLDRLVSVDVGDHRPEWNLRHDAVRSLADLAEVDVEDDAVILCPRLTT
jgi:hypothetical protein